MFFDCMNTRQAGEGKHKRKPDLDPYRSGKDVRLLWLENEFLGYLAEWDPGVQAREGFTATEMKKMTISQDTLEGLRMSVCSFVEMARYLLSQKPGLFLLSERFNQEPLESFFGQQRARGGRSDNPNVKTFLQNTQAIRVQQTVAIGDGGNVRKRKEQWTTDITDLSCPLKKRPRKTLHYGSE